MPGNDAAQDLALLIEASQRAAEIALGYFGKSPKVTHKDGGSPVSEADFAVDAYLRQTLCAARPDYGWLSEETEDDPARLDRETVFIVDPIDGTRAYLDGRKTWAVSVAVARAGQPVAGVVYLPMRDKLYSATLGGGARLNGAQVRTGSRAEAAGASVLAPRPSLEPRYWAGGLPRLDRHWRPSLAYRFCLVAEGRFDAMLTLRDAWEWDIAAGILIAAEAGATVTDRQGGAVRLNAPRPMAPGLLVAPPALHGVLAGHLLGSGFRPGGVDPTRPADASPVPLSPPRRVD